MSKAEKPRRIGNYLSTLALSTLLGAGACSETKPLRANPQTIDTLNRERSALLEQLKSPYLPVEINPSVRGPSVGRKKDGTFLYNFLLIDMDSNGGYDAIAITDRPFANDDEFMKFVRNGRESVSDSYTFDDIIRSGPHLTVLANNWAHSSYRVNPEFKQAFDEIVHKSHPLMRLPTEDAISLTMKRGIPAKKIVNQASHRIKKGKAPKSWGPPLKRDK